jgi:hypothetical protein
MVVTSRPNDKSQSFTRDVLHAYSYPTNTGRSAFQKFETLDTAPIIYFPSNLPQPSETPACWSLDGSGWQGAISDAHPQYQSEMQPAARLGHMEFNTPATEPWKSQVMTPQRLETVEVKAVSNTSPCKENGYKC